MILTAILFVVAIVAFGFQTLMVVNRYKADRASGKTFDEIV